MRGLAIVIKGAGEMASGIAHRLHRAGLTKILMTDIEEPLAVRRTVSFSEAVYVGKVEVEGVGPSCCRTSTDSPVSGDKGASPFLSILKAGAFKRSAPISDRRNHGEDTKLYTQRRSPSRHRRRSRLHRPENVHA